MYVAHEINVCLTILYDFYYDLNNKIMDNRENVKKSVGSTSHNHITLMLKTINDIINLSILF